MIRRDIMDNEGYTVVIVDDEEMVTTAIGTLFMLETEYNVLTFNSPSKALEALQTQEVDLVISDYLMQEEMNGVQFLVKMKKLQPEAIRILLGVHRNKEHATKAMNWVGLDIYTYVEKPWDNDRLLSIVQNGLQRKQLDSK